jgi:hypothetical protein
MDPKILSEVGPYVALLFGILVLAYIYSGVRKVDANTRVRVAELETALTQAQIVAEKERFQARIAEEKERSQREERLALSLANYQKETAQVNAGMMTMVATIITRQEKADATQNKIAEVATIHREQISGKVTESRTDILAAIEKAQMLIVQVLDILVKQGDQGGAIERIERALAVLASETEAAVAAVPEVSSAT